MDIFGVVVPQATTDPLFPTHRPVTTYRCTQCQKVKPFNQFGIHNFNGDGSRHKYCKACLAIRSRVFRLKQLSEVLKPIEPDSLEIDGESIPLSEDVYWPGIGRNGAQISPNGCDRCKQLERCRELEKCGDSLLCERVARQVIGGVVIVW